MVHKIRIRSAERQETTTTFSCLFFLSLSRIQFYQQRKSENEVSSNCVTLVCAFSLYNSTYERKGRLVMKVTNTFAINQLKIRSKINKFNKKHYIILAFLFRKQFVIFLTIFFSLFFFVCLNLIDINLFCYNLCLHDLLIANNSNT